MGIGVQPNCCEPKSLYLFSRKLQRFTGAASDVEWSGITTSAEAIDPGQRRVYGGNFPVVGIVSRSSRDGGDATTILSEPLLRRLCLSRQLKRFLFTTEESLGGGSFAGSVKSCNLDGSDLQTLYSHTNPAGSSTLILTAIGINVSTGEAVWIQHEATVGPLVVTHKLRAAPIGGGSISDLATLTSGQQGLPTIDYENNKIIITSGVADLYAVDFAGGAPSLFIAGGAFGTPSQQTRAANALFTAEFNPSDRRMYFTIHRGDGSNDHIAGVTGLWSQKPDGSNPKLEIPSSDIFGASGSDFLNFRLGEGFIKPKDVL